MPKRAVDSPAKAFCLEGNPKTLSSTAHRAEQAPAPAREHGHFVRVRMNVSKTTAPSETRGPSIAYAMHQRLLRKPQPPPKPGGQALRTQCKEQLDRGPLTTPKPPLTVYCTLRNHCPLRNQGANHFGSANIASTATQCKEQLDPTDHPKPPIAPLLEHPPKTAVPPKLRYAPKRGWAVAASAVRSRLRNHAGFTPVLPRFYPTFAPCRVKCRVSTLFLPRFYPVAPISFYPYG